MTSRHRSQPRLLHFQGPSNKGNSNNRGGTDSVAHYQERIQRGGAVDIAAMRPSIDIHSRRRRYRRLGIERAFLWLFRHLAAYHQGSVSVRARHIVTSNFDDVL